MYNGVHDDDLNATDKEITAALSLSSQWTNIRLQGFYNAESLSLQTLLDNGENIAVVDMEGFTGFTSKNLCATLGKCKQLKEFITLEQNYPDPTTDPSILGADLIEFIWASRQGSGRVRSLCLALSMTILNKWTPKD